MEEKNRIYISVRSLVEFLLRTGDIDNRRKSGQDVALMLEGARIHRMIQQRMGSDYNAEVPLKKVISLDEYDIVIEGRADGIICGEDNHVIDEIKTLYMDLDRVREPVPVHLAQAKCYAFIYAEQEKLSEITVRMTYVNQTSMETKYFHETYTFGEIKQWFETLIDRYRRWADHEFSFRSIRNDSIKETGFPFEYRAGQKELAGEVYRTISRGKKLFIEAPTGTGKTISALFPSVKAMGEGLCDKIFYLTAKTVTRTVAAQTLDILRRQGLKLKSVVITAKEKICPLESCECNPEGCVRAKGHFDRINDAMYDLLTCEDSFTRELIEEYALKHNVCPFEMCLDMSLFSDAVICDYNYVFDPNVYLRRFFADTSHGKYVFLVDEAHNLAERGMDMYSAKLYKEDFLLLKRLISETDKRLSRELGSGNRKLLSLKRECEEYMVLEDISDLIMTFSRLMARLETFLDEQENFKYRDEMLDFYFRLRHFLNMYDNMGEHDYRIYCEHVNGGDFMLKLLCVNPSDSLRLRLSKAVSTIFFSATLLPIGYYKDMLGADSEDNAVYAKSVFDEKKRGLFVARDVSSKYKRRNETEYYNIADYIFRVARAKAGNYMVFFPSHAFLYEVLNIYNGNFASNDVKILVQKQTMSETERESFLACFAPKDTTVCMEDTYTTLIGFCVMGGIFSEGIDLKNDSLIGAMIVGTGLPMVCSERKILKQAYESDGLDGFDYAYRFPGMNKVLQAAGRVIRTADDVGVIVLLDERFLTPPYLKLFPREWKRYEQMTISDVSDKLEEFWEYMS